MLETNDSIIRLITIIKYIFEDNEWMNEWIMNGDIVDDEYRKYRIQHMMGGSTDVPGPGKKKEEKEGKSKEKKKKLLWYQLLIYNYM